MRENNWDRRLKIHPHTGNESIWEQWNGLHILSHLISFNLREFIYLLSYENKCFIFKIEVSSENGRVREVCSFYGSLLTSTASLHRSQRCNWISIHKCSVFNKHAIHHNRHRPRKINKELRHRNGMSYETRNVLEKKRMKKNSRLLAKSCGNCVKSILSTGQRRRR